MKNNLIILAIIFIFGSFAKAQSPHLSVNLMLNKNSQTEYTIKYHGPLCAEMCENKGHELKISNQYQLGKDLFLFSITPQNSTDKMVVTFRTTEGAFVSSVTINIEQFKDGIFNISNDLIYKKEGERLSISLPKNYVWK